MLGAKERLNPISRAILQSIADAGSLDWRAASAEQIMPMNRISRAVQCRGSGTR